MQGYSNFRMVGVDERINNEYEKRYAHIYVGPANSKGKKTYYVWTSMKTRLTSS